MVSHFCCCSCYDMSCLAPRHTSLCVSTLSRAAVKLVYCSQPDVPLAALRIVPSQAAASCANRSYICRLDKSAIVLSAFDMGLLIVFLLAWAISIALARALMPSPTKSARLQTSNTVVWRPTFLCSPLRSDLFCDNLPAEYVMRTMFEPFV